MSATGSMTSYDTGSGTSAGTSVGTAAGTSGPATTSGAATSSSTAGSTTGDGTDTAGDTGPVDCAMTLFVNFDGVVLAQGPDDAPNNVSSVADTVGNTLDPYTGPVPRTEVMEALTTLFAPFPVCVTDSRPAAGPYTMAVVTSTVWNNGVTGLALSDCGNQNPNNVAVVFGEEIAAVPQVLASHIAHLFGLSLGLDKQGEDPDDVMAVPPGSGNTFKDACLELKDAAVLCAAQHTAFCPPGRQNSYAELMALGG